MAMEEMNIRISTIFTGKKVKLNVSDPWEFEIDTGRSFLLGYIQKAGFDRDGSVSLLVRIENCPIYKSTYLEYLVISSRLIDWKLDQLETGEAISCNMIRINREQANSTDPFDTSWWRGGAGLIGSIELVS